MFKSSSASNYFFEIPKIHSSVILIVFLGISAPGSDPEFRGAPAGLAEIFQSVAELSAEPTGE